MMSDVWNMDEPLEVGYRQPVCQSSDQSNNGKKEIEKQSCGKEMKGQELRSRRSPIKQIAFDSALSRRELKREVP